MCEICAALPYGACDRCAKAQSEMPKLYCEVFGEPLPVIDVLDYSPDDYYSGREVTVTVRNPFGNAIFTVGAPIDAMTIR